MSNGFPRELLQQPMAERLAYFEGYTVAHPKLKEANEAIIRAIREPAGASLIFVYGHLVSAKQLCDCEWSRD